MLKKTVQNLFVMLASDKMRPSKTQFLEKTGLES